MAPSNGTDQDDDALRVTPDSARAVAIAAAVLLSLYMGLALGYGDAIPLFEAPDEVAHLHYAVYVHDTGRMPEHPGLEIPGADGQLPLFYSITAPLLRRTRLDPTSTRETLRAVGLEIYRGDTSLPETNALRLAPRGAFHFATDGSLAELRRLRGASLAFGLLAVTFTFAAVWRVARDARLALLASALLAFNPQFLFVSASYSSDTATAAIGAAAMWIVLRAFEEGGPSRNQYLAGAAVIGLGCLTRLATLPGLAAAAMTIIAIDRRPERERRIDLAVAAGIVLLLAGPFALWSLNLGQVSAPGSPIPMASPIPRPEEAGSLLAYLTEVYFSSTFATFWGRFGWLDLAVPSGVLLALFTLCWTGALGYASGRVRERSALLRDRALHLYLISAVGLTGVAHLAVNLSVQTSDGRALFAIAPPLSLLVALGLGRLLGHEGRTLPLTVGIVAALVALDLYCLRGVLIPAYF